MRKYSEYKDSSIRWIEQVPSHWKEILNGQLFHENVRTPDSQNDCPLSLSQVDGLIPTDNMKERSLKSSSYDGWKRVLPNDLVLNRFKAHLGVMFSSSYTGMVSFHYGVYEPKLPMVTKYYEYLYHTEIFKTIYAYSSKGMTVGLQNLSNKDFYAIRGIYPPLSEQQHIVSFLDKKTSQIDEYISTKEKEIEALKEWKKALIARVVTKGLNKNAKMKDSGISWIGEVPEHWDIDKLGLHFRPRNEKVSDKDFPALSVSKDGVTPQLATAVKTDNGDNRKKVCVGDFVVNSRSDRKGSCGFSDYDGSVSLISIVITPIDLNPRYYHYMFRSNDYIEEFYRLGRGIVADLWTTRYVDMRNIMIPIPPKAEQKAIVDYIDKATTKADKMIVELTYHVEYMKEYKQRLIADVVTGKINVQP